MKKLVVVAGVVLVLMAGSVFGAVEFKRGQTQVTVGSNIITSDCNLKYVNYVEGETISITLNYSALYNIAFSGLNIRANVPFTPAKKVLGSIANITGLPVTPPATLGSVTFDLRFDQLKAAGKAKKFGQAHLKLILGVDTDGDGEIDDDVTITVNISVSTASHP